MVREDGEQPTPAAYQVRQKRRRGRDHEGDGRVHDRTAASREQEDQRQEHGWRQLERETGAERGGGRPPPPARHEVREDRHVQRDGGIETVGHEGTGQEDGGREDRAGGEGAARPRPQPRGRGGGHAGGGGAEDHHLARKDPVVATEKPQPTGQGQKRHGQGRILEKDVSIGSKPPREHLRVLAVNRDIGNVEEAVPGVAHVEQVDESQPRDRLHSDRGEHGDGR